jgi:hypothetical protein
VGDHFVHSLKNNLSLRKPEVRILGPNPGSFTLTGASDGQMLLGGATVYSIFIPFIAAEVEVLLPSSIFTLKKRTFES